MSNEKKLQDIDQELNDILAEFSRMEAKTSHKIEEPLPVVEETPAADTSVIEEPLKAIWDDEPRTKVFSLKKSKALLEKEEEKAAAEEILQPEPPKPVEELTAEPVKEEPVEEPKQPSVSIDEAIFDAIMAERFSDAEETAVERPSLPEEPFSGEKTEAEERYHLGHEEEEEASFHPLFDRSRLSGSAERMQKRMSEAKLQAEEDASSRRRKSKKDDDDEQEAPKEKKPLKQELLEWARDFAISFVIVAFFFIFICKIVTVDGGSMLPTLEDGDRLIVSGLFYTPESGDVVITNKDNGLEKRLVKRVIAVGGQTLDIDEDGKVYVNGLLLDEDYILEDTEVLGDHKYPMTIPEGYVFVMGDNRNNSLDSRFKTVGLIEEKDLIGRALLRVFPLDGFGKVQ